MWRDAWMIGRHDLKLMLRRRETLLWTFLMPAVFFYFIGSITGGGSFSGFTENLALQVDSSAGFLGDEVVKRLDEQGFDLVRFDQTGTYAGPKTFAAEQGQEAPVFDGFKRRLRIPAGFTESVLAGEQVILRFERRGDGLALDVDNFRLQRAVYTVLADVLAGSGMGSDSKAVLADLTHADIQALHATKRALRLEIDQAGKRKRIPGGFEQAVPGTMVMFTLLVLLTSGASTLVVERRAGLLRRLASSQMSRASVVLGKWIGKFALGAVQVGFSMLLGRYAFGVHWGPALPMLLLALASYAALVSSLGILVGNLARSEGQAISIGVLASTSLGALGGCWWPIEVTPDFMQKLAMVFPSGWMMDVMHKLMVFQDDWSTALPHVVGMLFCAWGLGYLCSKSFRFE